ncbi:sugar phosphate nucleotidyltransferase [Chloroflexota bacterium]
MKEVKAVILVGGEGTRLRPLTSSVPKPMVPVLNKPFLEHVFKYLSHHGIRDIVLALCYLPDNIQSYFGDGSDFGIHLTYVVEDFPLGTAGAVKNVSAHIDSTFLVLNGDVYTDLDISSMVALHKDRGAVATIALTSVEDPSAYGVVDTDADGKVKCFIEKPKWEDAPSNMINAGTYVLEPDVLRHVEPQTFCMFEHFLFPLLLDKGEPVYAYPSDAYWIDIGTPEKYASLNQHLLTGDCAIDGSCNIHPDAKIIGTVQFGRNCTIEPNVIIEGPTVIGDGCIIRRNSVIKKAIVWSDTIIDDGTRIENSIVGDGCRIGADACVVDGVVLGGKVVIGRGCKISRNVRMAHGECIDPDTVLE